MNSRTSVDTPTLESDRTSGRTRIILWRSLSQFIAGALLLAVVADVRAQSQTSTPFQLDESKDQQSEETDDEEQTEEPEEQKEKTYIREMLRLTIKNASSLEKKLTIYDNVCRKNLVYSKRFDGWESQEIKACKDFDGYADITVRKAFGGKKKRFTGLDRSVVLRFR